MIHMSLRLGDSLQIGDVTVRLADTRPGRGGKRVSLSIDAPREMAIHRVPGIRDGYDHSADDDLLAAMLEPRS